MLYPKIQRVNNRYRGPIESVKQINITNDINNAIEELKSACSVLEDKTNEIYKQYTNDDYNKSISDISALINDTIEMESINYGE